MPTPDRRAEATRYIDRVVALNKLHGGSGQVPPAEYQKAVERAAAIFARVRPANAVVADAESEPG
jgi:hypothetical protein